MARIRLRDRLFESDGRSVLDCLAAVGLAPASGCRAGVCQACVMRAVRGAIPERAQLGLSAQQRADGLFLACQCQPSEDMEVAAVAEAAVRFTTRVTAIERLGERVCALRLERPDGYRYRPGQFLRLHRSDQVARCYSLASVPALDRDIVLHVGRIAGGQVSAWVFDSLAIGDHIDISEALGSCCYEAGEPERRLLMIGTGCGLAPLYGILREALDRGHRGTIALFHGGRDASALYLRHELQQLARANRNFRYVPCAERGAGDAVRTGVPAQVALSEYPDLSGWRIYLCGNPVMVEAARIETFLAGAASSDIRADPHAFQQAVAVHPDRSP